MNAFPHCQVLPEKNAERNVSQPIWIFNGYWNQLTMKECTSIWVGEFDTKKQLSKINPSVSSSFFPSARSTPESKIPQIEPPLRTAFSVQEKNELKWRRTEKMDSYRYVHRETIARQRRYIRWNGEGRKRKSCLVYDIFPIVEGVVQYVCVCVRES